MLIRECRYCGVKADETELTPGYAAQFKAPCSGVFG